MSFIHPFHWHLSRNGRERTNFDCYYWSLILPQVFPNKQHTLPYIQLYMICAVVHTYSPVFFFSLLLFRFLFFIIFMFFYSHVIFFSLLIILYFHNSHMSKSKELNDCYAYVRNKTRSNVTRRREQRNKLFPIEWIYIKTISRCVNKIQNQINQFVIY